MIIRPLAPLALALAIAACAPGDDAPPADESEEAMTARAQEIHDRVVTLDTHIDISTSNFTDERNYTMDLPTQATLPKMEAGGLDVGWFVVYTGQGPLTEEGYAAAYENAIDKFDAIHRLVNEYAPEQIELALTSDDVRRIAASGKLVAMIGVENAYPLGTDISRVEEFLRPRRPLHVARAHPSQPALRRPLRRERRQLPPQRPQRDGPRSGRRDEPSRDHDRHLAPVEGVDPADARNHAAPPSWPPIPPRAP